jgi:hypothetical protein
MKASFGADKNAADRSRVLSLGETINPGAERKWLGREGFVPFLAAFLTGHSDISDIFGHVRYLSVGS